uniref:Putative reverse transcriptase n=1 Tax=Arabidopsis thaliana TaxID=3702 RepID=Q9ZQX2_ARATH|nr:putative reverse transcriptase [Arabidopsis thaliana]
MALFSMPRNKAPGPDGFPVEFFLEAWPIVKESFIAAIKEFFLTGHLLKGFNATAITLIPKVPGADQLNLFRPVACCTTIYKVITRLISKRLNLFIDQAVQSNQVGFIKGRLLCENVLLASELVDNFQAEGDTSRGCLQVDLTKAYDNVNWEFLINILKALNLPPIFINWIWVCISTPSYSIAYNGELIGFFVGKKGIRQGDPMSSHLFVLVMDILARSLDLGAVEGRFVLHPKCLAPMITHLSFADDILVFCDGSLSSLVAILDILDVFKKGSGLGINLQKTALLLDGGNFERNRIMAASLGVSQGSLPVRYLGVPLMSQKMKKHDYQPLVDRINSRFTSWTARHLSFAGRLQLLKSVIYSTINFWASIFILPNQCLHKLEQMCNAFLWSGAPNSAREAKISWDILVGLSITSVVRDAIRNDDWWIASSRSRNPVILLLKSLLPPVGNLVDFSWHKAVWFTNQVPKHAFISWVTAWNRLHTRDRLRSWGLIVPAECVLCNLVDETRDHLFFACFKGSGFGVLAPWPSAVMAWAFWASAFDLAF